MGKFYIKKSKTISGNTIKKVDQQTDLIIDGNKKIVEEELTEIKKKTINTLIKSNNIKEKEVPIVEEPIVEANPITIKKGTVVANKVKTTDNSDVFKPIETVKTLKSYKIFNDLNGDYVFNIDKLDNDFIEFSGFNQEFTGFLEHKELYLKVYDIVKGIKSDRKIPKIVHLCYAFKDDCEFTFFNYLCVLSIVNKIKPDMIILYHHYDITGKWWDRVKMYVKTVRTKQVNSFNGNQITHFAHMSDVIRLEMLRFVGGIYMDIDTFVNKSFNDLLDNEFVIGIQNSGGKDDREYYGLCNAIMLSEKQSKFATEWLKSYDTFNRNNWDYHSVIKPYYLAKEFPDHVTILPPKKFFPFLWGQMENYLLTSNSLAMTELKDCYSMHLWETNEQKTLSKINFETIFDTKNNVYHLFKDYLVDNSKATVSFIFLTHNRPEKTINYINTYINALNRPDVKEIIIYDNGSTNQELLGYLNYINKIDGVKVIFGPENIGVAGGRDVLFKHVTGDVVFSVDSDSKLIDQTFIDDAKEILNDKNIWVCGTVGAFFKGWVHGTHVDVNDDSNYEGEVDTLAGCCQIFRKKILEHIWVDLDFAPFWYEDTDFCFQAKVLGGKIFRFHFNNKFHHVWGGSGNQIFGNKLFEEKHKIMLKKWRNNKKLKLMHL